MAEQEIKRVNFFDGQFLKQAEFLDFDAYHLHMRRRWGFVLFNQSGVIQANPSDLTVQVPDVNQKVVVVKSGMAIGKRADLAEAKEIVLREDKIVDLNAQNLSWQAGDTAIITVHYDDEPVAQPPSEGDVPGNTRIREHARVTVHRNSLAGAAAANGEPFIRLGDVDFSSMNIINPALRQTAFLRTSLLAPTPQISLSPNTAPASGAVSIAVTSSGGLNLSTATAASVVFSSMDGISNVQVSNPAAASLTLTFTLTNAAAGSRTVTITVNNVSASATFTVQAGLQLTQPIPVPLGGTDLGIEGSGFAANQPAIVQFAGGVPAITVPASNVTATKIQIPVTMIPDNATKGTITVTSGGETKTSTFPVTPPAKIVTLTFLDSNNIPVPGNQGNVGQILKITGKRFIEVTDIGIVNALRSSSPPPFPGMGGESAPSVTELRVKVVPSAGGSPDGTVKVMNAGGTVESTARVSIA